MSGPRESTNDDVHAQEPMRRGSPEKGFPPRTARQLVRDGLRLDCVSRMNLVDLRTARDEPGVSRLTDGSIVLERRGKQPRMSGKGSGTVKRDDA